MPRLMQWTAVVAAAVLLAGCGSGSNGGGGDTGGEGKGRSSPAAAPTTSPEDAASSRPLPASLTAQRLDWGRCKAGSGSPAPRWLRMPKPFKAYGIERGA
ncbi:hypothetical protein ABT314_18850, partial [Streptomyces spiralis]